MHNSSATLVNKEAEITDWVKRFKNLVKLRYENRRYWGIDLDLNFRDYPCRSAIISKCIAIDKSHKH